MATQAKLASGFKKAAINFDVAESDFLLLESLGVKNFEQLTYRLPRAENLEEFLQNKVYPSAAFKREDGSILVFARPGAVVWSDFKASDDAGALRKLWAFGKEICKSELEAMASGDGEKAKPKMTVASSTAMEAQAVAGGMPSPISDAERPSLYSLTKASQSLVSPGANFEYVGWEHYFSVEEEGRLQRAGRLPKAQPELIIGKANSLSLREKFGQEAPLDKVEKTDQLRKCLELRARTHAMIEASSYQVYRDLNDRYISKMGSTVPEGMRCPSINEIRRFDRVLHEDILRWLSRDTGDLTTALKYHLDRDDIPLWRLLDPVMAALPDQGIESGKMPTEHKSDKKRKHSSDDGEGSDKKEEKPKRKRKCLVCGKKHTPFCTLTPEIRKKLKNDKKAKANQANQDKKSG